MPEFPPTDQVKKEIIMFMYAINNKMDCVQLNVKSIQESTYQLCREVTLNNFDRFNNCDLSNIRFLLSLYIHGKVNEDFLKNVLLSIKT